MAVVTRDEANEYLDSLILRHQVMHPWVGSVDAAIQEIQNILQWAETCPKKIRDKAILLYRIEGDDPISAIQRRPRSHARERMKI